MISLLRTLPWGNEKRLTELKVDPMAGSINKAEGFGTAKTRDAKIVSLKKDQLQDSGFLKMYFVLGK